MLFQNLKTYHETRKLKKIGKLVRAGKVPRGVDQDTVFKALRATKPTPNAVEVFGILSAHLQKTTGQEHDYGVVSVRKVTEAFTKRLVDALTDSAVTLAGFNQHKMGAGSTAEATADSDLITKQAGSQSGNATQTHGSSSSIYQSVGTLTAGSSYGCREHGLFNASTGGILLDRSVVTNIDLNTDDIVTWTYALTCTHGG